MASGKQSPRQKMINMMYLVLTALLALNVSKEILDAFVVVNEGMLIQKTNIEANNNRIYTDFEQQKVIYKEDYQRIKEYYEKAFKVKDMADKIVGEIDVMKAEIIAEAEQKTKEEVLEKKLSAKDLTKLEDYDIPTRYFGTDDESKIKRGEGAAPKLKKMIAEFRDKLLSKDFLKDMKDAESFNFNLATEDVASYKKLKEDPNAAKESWEMFYFYHLPIPAALTELTKWQNNIRDAEGQMVRYQYAKISASSYKFDAIEAAIIPKSNVVFAGSPFEADIFLAAYNTTENPEVIVNGASLSTYENGRAKFSVTAAGEGEKTVSGIIRVKDPISGQVKDRPFETKYQVAKPMMTVSPDKMNVFYRGLDNPVSISVPGVAPSQIKASCTGCASFTPKGNGQFTVKPGSGNEANINVTVTTADGKSKNMGAARFRIKRIPDPTIKFSGKKSNESLSVVEATSGGALIPMLEDFDFEVYATIREFTVSFDPGTGSIYDKKCNGNIIPSDVAGMMKRIPRGKKLYFDGIKVNMPDGTVRNSTAVYTIR